MGLFQKTPPENVCARCGADLGRVKWFERKAAQGSRFCNVCAEDVKRELTIQIAPPKKCRPELPEDPNWKIRQFGYREWKMTAASELFCLLEDVSEEEQALISRLFFIGRGEYFKYYIGTLYRDERGEFSVPDAARCLSIEFVEMPREPGTTATLEIDLLTGTPSMVYREEPWYGRQVPRFTRRTISFRDLRRRLSEVNIADEGLLSLDGANRQEAFRKSETVQKALRKSLQDIKESVHSQISSEEESVSFSDSGRLDVFRPRCVELVAKPSGKKTGSDTIQYVNAEDRALLYWRGCTLTLNRLEEEWFFHRLETCRFDSPDDDSYETDIAIVDHDGTLRHCSYPFRSEDFRLCMDELSKLAQRRLCVVGEP